MSTATKPQLMSRDIMQGGMPLKQFAWKSSQATVAEGDDWAAVYFIESTDRNKGHATELMKILKFIYETKGKTFGGTIALNPAMKRVYEKSGVYESEEEA